MDHAKSNNIYRQKSIYLYNLYMLSVLSKIKNNIRDFVKKKRLHRRLRNYAVVIGDDIMTPDVDVTNDKMSPVVEDIDSGLNPPPPSPVKTRRLFNIELDESIIKADYELQDLLKMMDIHGFDITNVTLEKRFETSVNELRNISDIVKIKVRLLYMIIANDMYRNMFEEKKQYNSVKISQYVGVFRYNDYIIRIDDCPYSFINESDVISATSKCDEATNVIRPFLVYMNIRHNYTQNNTCDCKKPNCGCVYIDRAEQEFDCGRCIDEDDVIARRCFERLRKNTISFSIQYYVKDTVSLYTWVKETMTTDIYNRFSSIQHTFFIELFYRCALLLRDIHSVHVVHGDIKPDNILFREHSDFNINHPEKCKNFTVYLIDFGLSGLHNVGIGTGGTIPYCHPEFKNIQDTNRVSKYNWKTQNMKHDVWSLGLSFLTIYIYRDFYNYYHKYPNYFFLKNGYVSSLIVDVITNSKINELFTQMMTADCIPIKEVCRLLQDINTSLGD